MTSFGVDKYTLSRIRNISFPKKCVLSLRLKSNTFSQFLNSIGNSFQIFGAVVANAQSPAVLNRVLGMSRSFLLPDRKERPLLSGLSNSLRFWGPFPYSTLKVITAILQWIQNLLDTKFKKQARF